MIRNFLYTILGLSIFISGGMLGPKLWTVIQGNTEVSSSPQAGINSQPVADKDSNNSKPNTAIVGEQTNNLEQTPQNADVALNLKENFGQVDFAKNLFSLQTQKPKAQEKIKPQGNIQSTENAQAKVEAQKQSQGQTKEQAKAPEALEVPEVPEVLKKAEPLTEQMANNEKNAEENPAQAHITEPKKSEEISKPTQSQEIAKKNQEIAPKVIEQKEVEKTEVATKDTKTEKTEKVASSEGKTASLTEEYKDTFKKDLGLDTIQIVKTKVEEGDNLLEIFLDHTDQKSAYALAKTIGKVHPVTRFQIGKSYTLEHDTEKEKITYFEYEISDTEKLIFKDNGGKYHAFIEKVEYDKKLSFVKGQIEDSLYSTMLKLNEKESLALTVVNMFKWDVNFIKDVRKGDSFTILVEKLYLDGEFKGYGRTIGGSFTNNGKTLESFLYHDSNKREMHYNAKGENMRKVLLQSPLRVTRITSGYTHRRRHPIYGTYRPHLGIDYGAPMGTPIVAVGAGTVTYLGWRGGFGKHITVRHASGLESLYSHLSRYGRSLRKGSKVRQGQIIGYVGSTGVSTGPHLDFRLKQNGKYINPTKAINPRAAAISKAEKRGYEARKKIIREFMDGTRPLESYDPKLLGLVAENRSRAKKKK